MIKIGKAIWNFLLNMQRVILVICSLFLVFTIGLTVVFRYILNIDLFGLEEIIVIPAFWMFFIGASYGTYKKKHISAELVSVYVKKDKPRKIVETITSFVTLSLCLLITYWSIQFFSWSFTSGATSSAWRIPQYIPHSAVLFGFLLMTFYFIVHFIVNVKELVTLYK